MDNRKILIVDDEKPTREVMARILSASYECLLAPDAELAMDALDRNPDIALLITDYKMPGKNGVELIKKTKENHPSVACILVTAFGEIELAVAAMKDGADDFLTKPITDIAQMEQRVAKAIEKTRFPGRSRSCSAKSTSVKASTPSRAIHPRWNASISSSARVRKPTRAC